MRRSRSVSETESLLRATLAGRAARVARAAGTPDPIDLPARRRAARWAPPLAAAGTAAVVAGVVVALQHGGHDSGPAATPTGSPGTVPTSTAPASPSLTPTDISSPASGPLSSCTATLPAAWRRALSTRVDVGSSPYLLAAFSDGQLLVRRAAVAGQAANLALVSPDGAIRELLAAPGPGTSVAGSVDGDWAVLIVLHGGDSTGQGATVSSVVAYDESTGRQTPVALPAGVVDAVAVMDGTVYFDQRASAGARTGQVIAYNPATGASHAAWTGHFPDAGHPGAPLDPTIRTLAGGVYLGTADGTNTVLVAPRALPRAVAARMTPEIREGLLVSDGTSYAWLGGGSRTSSRSLYLWSPGMSVPTHVVLAKGFPELVGGDDGAAHFAIEGHWLFASLQRPTVVDLATGAVLTLPGQAIGYTLLGDYLVGVPPGSSYLARVRLDGQPNLNC